MMTYEQHSLSNPVRTVHKITTSDSMDNLRPSRKRKFSGDDVQVTPKRKPGVNFHSIADLMRSDAKTDKSSHKETNKSTGKFLNLTLYYY